MKIILLLSIIFCFGGCINKSKKMANISVVSDTNFVGQRFPYEPENNSLIFLEILIQGKHPATFLLDNGTGNEDKIIFNREFARKKLLKDTGYLDEIHFQKDSVITFSFGSLSDTSFNNPINSLPQGANFLYDGIIGLGVLNKYLLEINYNEKYFMLHTDRKIDTTLFEKIQLIKKGVCPAIPVTFYKGTKAYSHNALLDLGKGGSGFLWGSKAVNLFSPDKKDLFNIKKNGASMTGGFSGTTADITFDSISLFKNNKLFKINAQFIQSGSGVLASDQIWFGNDVLKNFGRLYFDFENDLFYIPKNIR